MSESDRRITAGDLLLYRRCPRSLHRKLSGGALPPAFPADDLYPTASDRARVRAIARSLFPNALVAGSPEAVAATSGDGGPGDGAARAEAPGATTLFEARCRYGRFEAVADVWHPQKPSGMAAVIVRESTTIKESALVEAAFLDYCFSGCGAAPTKIFVYHVNKSYERDGAIDPRALLVERDVTRRARRNRDSITAELEALEAELDADPTLERYRDAVCRRPESCPLCAGDLPVVGVDHISNLYRGGALTRELLAEGFESILAVPTDRLVHPRQAIQQRVLRDGLPHVDDDAIAGFLGRLEYPVSYLDFEATSSAVPDFDGVRPWEHVPFLYSVHRELADGSVEHRSFMAAPCEDERREMAARLVAQCGSSGSIVVYSAGFERGILRRLAERVPEEAERLDALADRIVDLLEPFNEFAYYHSEQRSKVSLKTVLPILTGRDYRDESVQDGYTANQIYRYLCERRQAGAGGDEEQTALLAALESYCAMDTMAMVHIVRELRAITARRAL